MALHFSSQQRQPIEYKLTEFPWRVAVRTRFGPREVERWLERHPCFLRLIMGRLESNLSLYHFDCLVSVDSSGTSIAGTLKALFWHRGLHLEHLRVEKAEPAKNKPGRRVYRSYFHGKDCLVIPWRNGELEGKHVLIVEDDILSGRTLEILISDAMQIGGASSVSVAVLLNWRDLRPVTLAVPMFEGATVVKDEQTDLSVTFTYSVSRPHSVVMREGSDSMSATTV